MTTRRRLRVGRSALSGMSSTTCAFLVAAACLALMATAHTPRVDNARGFLFDPTHTDFSIPLRVSVGLVGFDGDGGGSVRLPSESLQRALSEALPVHVPAVVEAEAAGRVQFHLEYRAAHLERAQLTQLEDALKKAMRLIGTTAEGVSVYDIAAEKVEPFFDSLYSSLVSPTAGSATVPPLGALLVNPDKVRMNPTASGRAPYVYRYRYERGAATQQWVARQRYVLVDLAAGPCTYGPSDTGEGTVSLGSVPLVDVRPDDGQGGENVASVKFVSELASLLLSAVRHVFVGDAQWARSNSADKVIVPVVVFRNHRRFHPLRQEGGADSLPDDAAGPVNEFKIDLAVIKQQVRALLLPEQELLVVHGAHHLHDHHHLSAAVFKALKQDSVHTASSEGVFSAQTRPYLDSKILIEELEHASDDIVAGLMMSEGLGSARAPLPGASSRPAGHRVLPVFVLSLLGLPPNLLLDHKHLHVATSRCVVVLQTGSHPIAVPYFSDGSLVHLNPRTPTRHVVAGVASALGGVGAPYQRFDVAKRRSVNTFLWANGAVPWGPFSNSSALSSLFTDSAVRNGVIVRINGALRAVHRAMASMRRFHAAYIEDSDLEPEQLVLRSAPFGTGPNTQDDAQKKGVALLARDVSVRLALELEGIEKQFLQLSADIQQHKWASSTRLSGAILVTARAFAKYVETEIDSARRSLECCHKVYSAPGSSSLSAEEWFVWLFPLLLPTVLAVALFLGVRRQRSLRDRPSMSRTGGLLRSYALAKQQRGDW